MDFSKYKETLKIRTEKLKGKPLKEIYIELSKMVEEIAKMKAPFEVEEIETDRDMFECIQETYSFLYCIINEYDYKTLDVVEHMDKDDFFKWLVNYKINHFGKDILKELGYELVDVVPEGYIIRENETPKIVQ